MSTKCPECGLLHPPVAKGECPIAKEKSLEELEKAGNNERIVKYQQAIRTKLQQKLSNMTDEQQENFSSDVFKFIDKY